MFDCGQPTHIFDLDKISEKLIIRQVQTVRLCDAIIRLKLKSSDLVY